MRQITSFFCILGLAWVLSSSQEQEKTERWYKGNTHTHTLWSDGNGAPELVADWYVSHGYDFLVLSDHDVLSVGEKWFPIEETGRLNDAQLALIKSRYGEKWVVEREVEGKRMMRLKTLGELRREYSKEEEFLFIQGEEISASYKGQAIHVNAINLVERIKPKKGGSLRETLQANINAVMAQAEKERKPMLAHVNHPNFGWALTVDDLASIEGERYFEVYNGHSGVRNYGDETHPSTEEMWDQALVKRLVDLDLPPLFGLATDDAHEYFSYGVGKTNPGRGWVMVKAKGLSGDAIVEAMRRGNFYSSSGVTLKDFDGRMGKFLSVSIDGKPGVTYTTQFIGSRMKDGKAISIGEVLAESTENPARYDFAGDELYVRAKVISSEDHPNPYAAGDKQCAWVQPVCRPLF
ncbi:MAG: hypothetical protein ACI8X5_001968 [Planctomycetota bacterium]|jgi:hypothetical protein